MAKKKVVEIERPFKDDGLNDIHEQMEKLDIYLSDESPRGTYATQSLTAARQHVQQTFGRFQNIVNTLGIYVTTGERETVGPTETKPAEGAGETKEDKILEEAVA